MFSLQEYQHVHLLWFKKQSFTLVWKPNPPLRSVCCVHLSARADAASINQALRARAESASLHVISEIFLLLQCGVALQRTLYEADALEQRRPCTRTSATTSNFYSHTLKKWSQSRALPLTCVSLTLQRPFPLTIASVLNSSRLCRWAKGLTAPHDSRKRVIRTDARIFNPSLTRGLVTLGAISDESFD